MNVLPLDEAERHFIERKKHNQLKEAIMSLQEGQALFVPFSEFKDSVIQSNVGNLRRQREQARLCTRKHEDGSGVFVFFTPIAN